MSGLSNLFGGGSQPTGDMIGPPAPGLFDNMNWDAVGAIGTGLSQVDQGGAFNILPGYRAAQNQRNAQDDRERWTDYLEKANKSGSPEAGKVIDAYSKAKTAQDQEQQRTEEQMRNYQEAFSAVPPSRINQLTGGGPPAATGGPRQPVPTAIPGILEGTTGPQLTSVNPQQQQATPAQQVGPRIPPGMPAPQGDVAIRTPEGTDPRIQMARSTAPVGPPPAHLAHLRGLTDKPQLSANGGVMSAATQNPNQQVSPAAAPPAAPPGAGRPPVAPPGAGPTRQAAAQQPPNYHGPRAQAAPVMNAVNQRAKAGQMFTDQQLEFAKALGPRAGQAYLAKEAGKTAVSPYVIQNTPNGLVAIDKNTLQVKQLTNVDGTLKDLPPALRAAKQMMSPEAFEKYAPQWFAKQVKSGGSGGPLAGLSMGFDAEGNPTISFGKSASNKLQKEIIDSGELVSEWSAARSAFNPDSYTFSGGMQNKWLSWKDKAGVGLDEAEYQDMMDFHSSRIAIADLINRQIKDLGGANVTEIEWKRYKPVMPIITDNPWEGDGPMAVKIKMDAAYSMATSTHLRKLYMNETGAGLETTAKRLPLRKGRMWLGDFAEKASDPKSNWYKAKGRAPTPLEVMEFWTDYDPGGK